MAVGARLTDMSTLEGDGLYIGHEKPLNLGALVLAASIFRRACSTRTRLRHDSRHHQLHPDNAPSPRAMSQQTLW